MKKRIILIMMISMMLTGCNQAQPIEKETKTQDDQQVSDSIENLEEETEETEEVNPKDEIDLSLKPDESGKIMVLMYHNIGEEEQEWVRTPENFKKDLLNLYEKGYRPISLRDYVNGNIRTPEGYTPVVLTFDDGNENNFRYLEDGSIDKDSAVGILLDFNKEYPDFNGTATFFLTGSGPFRQGGKAGDKINFLLENGMDVGNHTRTHANFTQISKEDLQEEIGGQAAFIEDFIEDESYKVNTLALPYGTRPKDESLMDFLGAGNYNGVDYENIAILNVGWNPAHSPYDTRFDFQSIPRIRASEMKVDNVGMYNYIEYFDNNPGERFISDGFSEIITVPEGKLDLIETDTDREIYQYKSDKTEDVSN